MISANEGLTSQSISADDERPNDEPDMNIGQDAYRGVTFDEWARLAVRVGLKAL